MGVIATPFIGPLILEWGQKLTDQLAMRAMDLYTTETCFLTDGSTAPKTFNDLDNLCVCGFARRVKKCSHVLAEDRKGLG